MYNIEGYSMVCTNRCQGKGGGIAIYVLEELSFTVHEDIVVYVDREFEYLFLEINC